MTRRQRFLRARHVRFYVLRQSALPVPQRDGWYRETGVRRDRAPPSTTHLVTCAGQTPSARHIAPPNPTGRRSSLFWLRLRRTLLAWPRKEAFRFFKAPGMSISLAPLINKKTPPRIAAPLE